MCSLFSCNKCIHWTHPLRSVIVPQLKKFLAFNGACMFIAISTRVHHSIISWSVRFHLHPHILFLKIVFNIISLSVLMLPKYFLRLRFSYHFHGSTNFPQIWEPSQNNVRQKSDKKQTSYWIWGVTWATWRPPLCVPLMHCWSFRACYIALPT